MKLADQCPNCVKRFLCDTKLRAVFSATVSFAANAGYAILNGVIAAASASVWFGALAGYYLLLALLRGGVLLHNRRADGFDPYKKERSKQRTSLICGVSLLILILILSAAISQMVVYGATFRYQGLMIYAGATYTFMKVTVATVNFVKSRKKRDVTVDTIRNINLADALVSILALQTAMFQSFAGGQDVSDANAATGAVVCVLVLGLGLLMITKASKALRKLEKDESHGTGK